MDPHASFAEIGAKYDRYVADMRATRLFGRRVDTPMARLVAVAATDEAADGSPAPAPRGRSAPMPTVPRRRHWRAGRAGWDGAERSIERYVRECIVWGSPGRVRDELARLADEMRLRHLMIAPLSHDSFVRFTDDVLPHV